MSLPDATIDGRLLESARRHFLEKGFLNAQLKDICDDADVTTGALYKRYRGKEELFDALVAGTLREIEESISRRAGIDLYTVSDQALAGAWANTYDGVMEWFSFCNAHRDGFVLLVRCAAGTRYGNFLHDFCAHMTEIDYQWLVEMQRRGLCRTDIDARELHVLLTAYWEAYYEPFVHDFTWEEIHRHATIMCKLFNWKDALEIKL